MNTLSNTIGALVVALVVILLLAGILWATAQLFRQYERTELFRQSFKQWYDSLPRK